MLCAAIKRVPPPAAEALGVWENGIVLCLLQRKSARRLAENEGKLRNHPQAVPYSM